MQNLQLLLGNLARRPVSFHRDNQHEVMASINIEEVFKVECLFDKRPARFLFQRIHSPCHSREQMPLGAILGSESIHGFLLACFNAILGRSASLIASALDKQAVSSVSGSFESSCMIYDFFYRHVKTYKISHYPMDIHFQNESDVLFISAEIFILFCFISYLSFFWEWR